MIFLYSAKNFPGLNLLVSALGAVRLSRFDGESFWTKDRKARISIPSGSHLIAWGAPLPEMEDIRVLNGVEKAFNKLEMHTALSSVGAKTLKAWPSDLNSLTTWNENKGTYLPRRFGEKLVPCNSIKAPDYYTEIMTFDKEYTIHSFNKKSIRGAGVKKPIPGRVVASLQDTWALDPHIYAHPWVRSEECGWTTDYSTETFPEIRSLAHKAVNTLGLNFASVDIGTTSSGNHVVINVNTTPDLNGPNAVKAYIKAISKWVTETQGGSNANF